MELLYLLCSIISTLLTSLALSLLLHVRMFFRWHFPSSAAYSSSFEAVTLYEGTVWHERRRPTLHSFKYRVRYALVDLDLTPQSLPNHLSSDEARRVAKTNGPVFLLTIPPSVGYEQNPLSLYYCYDQQDSGRCLKKCIAEVTNTPWGERVSFLFTPNADTVAKALHVSPFMDMLGNWTIKATGPGDTLSVGISVHHPDLGDYFSAVLRAKKVSSDFDHKLFFWLMPHKVAGWIYWHAFQLWWKNVPLVQHPRYISSAYRDEALLRDHKLKCCLAERSGSSDSRLKNDVNVAARWFEWRDAKWPWC